MDRGMVLFVGALMTFTSSWLGLVLFPFWQLQYQSAYQPEPNEDPYPRPLQGLVWEGMKVYQRNGCMYCHSQQIRSERFGNWWDEPTGIMRTGADIKRGWGLRRNVSRDYIYDNPTMLGTMRTGPDLANVGMRYSASWQHIHTYNPRALNSWSLMPSFAFLYRKERIIGSRSDKALPLGREWTVRPGYRWRPSADQWQSILQKHGTEITQRYHMQNPQHAIDINTPIDQQLLLEFWLTTPEEDWQIIPTEQADALIAYLLSLRKAEIPLPEAKE
jgi:cytochrome c oxidase cbb3-type subunit 2